MTLDAVGAWPPISESHVEMDGAWALYEAWLKIQAGHADTALVYSYSKASPGDLPRVLSRQLDPYYYGPLWPDSVAMAGLQARPDARRRQDHRGGDGRPSPTATARPPGATPTPRSRARDPVDELLGERVPLRSAAPPRRAADHRRRRARSCSPPATGPASGPSARRGSGASTTGSTATTSAPVTSPSPSIAKLAGEKAGVHDGDGRHRRAPRPLHPSGEDRRRRRSASATTSWSTRRAGRWPPTR